MAPLLARLPPGARGLDYGAGRAGTLAALLAERGFDVDRFDPCFAAEHTLLEQKYDFVTCTEVVEHFHDPRREFSIMSGLLRPASHLAITTSLASNDTDWASWWYARDETHVSFYCRETLAWIAEHFDWEVVDLSAQGALFLSR